MSLRQDKKERRQICWVGAQHLLMIMCVEHINTNRNSGVDVVMIISQLCRDCKGFRFFSETMSEFVCCRIDVFCGAHLSGISYFHCYALISSFWALAKNLNLQSRNSLTYKKTGTKPVSHEPHRKGANLCQIHRGVKLNNRLPFGKIPPYGVISR